MKASDLREKTTEELETELIALRKEQFNLRMQHATGQGARPDQNGKVKRNIARLKTVLNERGREVKQGEAS